MTNYGAVIFNFQTLASRVGKRNHRSCEIGAIWSGTWDMIESRNYDVPIGAWSRQR